MKGAGGRGVLEEGEEGRGEGGGQAEDQREAEGIGRVCPFGVALDPPEIECLQLATSRTRVSFSTLRQASPGLLACICAGFSRGLARLPPPPVAFPRCPRGAQLCHCVLPTQMGGLSRQV